MKKCLSVLLSVLLLTAMLVTSVSAADFSLVRNVNYDIPLINTLANVQEISGAEAQTVLTGENAPGLVLVSVSELTDVKAFVQLCMDHNVVPNFRVADNKEAQQVVDAMEELDFKDVTVISSNAATLKYVRNKKAVVRTGLEVTLEKDTLTSKEAHELRVTVRSAPATFCVMDATFASRQVVAELQELAVAVWVKAEDTEVSVLRAVTSGANGVISANAYETAALMNEVLEKSTVTRTPVMIGHRGNPTQAPENSLSGFLKAYENGADVFEVDVEITSDGEIIIMHDSTLNRTTDYTGNQTVNNMTLSEIKQYHLRGLDGKVTDETVPTFREVLEAFKDKDCRIYVEFKGSNQKNVPATLDLVKEYDMEDRVDVISFNSNFLTQTQTNIPGMSTGYLQSPSGATMNELVALETFYSSVIKTQLVNSTINPGKGVITKHYLQAATNRGMTVWPWTYQASTANMAFIACPDGITTDDVQWSKDMLKYIQAATEVQVDLDQTVDLAVSGTTYGGQTSDIAVGDRILTVLGGEDVIAVENGVITSKAYGTAQVLIGYRTKTAGNTDYVLYTQPITINVVDPASLPTADATPDDTQGGMDPLVLSLIIAAAVVVIGAVIVVIVLRKPKQA